MDTPVYDHDGVTLYQGDCLTIMPTLPQRVGMILADLPYGTTRNHWDRPLPNKLLWHCYRQLAGPRTPIVLFGTGRFGAELIVSNAADYRYTIVWDKDAVSGHLNAKRQPLRCHEDLMVFYGKQPTYHPQMVDTGRRSHSRGTKRDRTINHYGLFENTGVVDQGGMQYPRTIVKSTRPKSGQHPNQKPVELCEWLIRTFTDPGDLVLDNVAGVATTLIAARNTGRRGIGIEDHAPYIERAVARLHSGATGDRW